MAHYRFVWDPNGVPFEVPPEKASDLILNHGWSNIDPATRGKKGKKSSASAKGSKAPVADTEVNHGEASENAADRPATSE